MISRNITIKNSVGLYARPATFFIQKANTYKSSIWIQKDDRRVNAKSLLGVLSMAIISQPDSVSHFAKDLISLVVVPNSRSSCSPPLFKQATMTFLCTSIPQQHR